MVKACDRLRVNTNKLARTFVTSAVGRNAILDLETAKTKSKKMDLWSGKLSALKFAVESTKYGPTYLQTMAKHKLDLTWIIQNAGKEFKDLKQADILSVVEQLNWVVHYIQGKYTAELAVKLKVLLKPLVAHLKRDTGDASLANGRQVALTTFTKGADDVVKWLDANACLKEITTAGSPDDISAVKDILSCHKFNAPSLPLTRPTGLLYCFLWFSIVFTGF